MRRTGWLKLAAAALFAAGCATPTTPESQAPAGSPVTEAGPGGGPSSAPPPTTLAADRYEAPIVPATDPERTRRAREIYLSGVRLLSTQPPQVDQAMREFQQALEIDPLFYRAHFKLGICYYLRGQYHLEINEYKLALATNPKYVPAWLNLGHAYLVMDELEEARDAYEHVLDHEPNHAVALYNKALVEFDLGNERESLRLFRQFMDVDGSGEMGERARSYIEELKARAGVDQG